MKQMILAILLLAGAACADPTNGLYPTTVVSTVSTGTTQLTSSTTAWKAYILPAYTTQLWASANCVTSTWQRIMVNVNGPYTSTQSLACETAFDNMSAGMTIPIMDNGSLGPITLNAGITGATVWYVGMSAARTINLFYFIGSP